MSEPLQDRMDELNRRLTDVESRQQEDRHTSGADYRGVRFGQELLHRDVRDLRDEVMGLRAETTVTLGGLVDAANGHAETLRQGSGMLVALDQRMSGISARLDEQSVALTEIMNRLPPARGEQS